MTLFEQLKMIPKVDMHINLTSSISTNLAAFINSDKQIVDLLYEMQERNYKDYENSLKLSIEILNNQENISLAIDDMINQLIKNNVIYSELFVDLPLYNKETDEEELILNIFEVIKKRKYNLQLVLVLSSSKTKEENLKTLSLFEKYYGKGVNGIYFSLDKMDDLSNYMYLFDRLIKNNYPYILNMYSKMTNQDSEIYYHAKRIIYSLSNFDDGMLDELRQRDITLEIAITRFRENKVFDDYKDYFIYDLMKNNISLAITSQDMTTLNTDILNEWCILFNNYPLTLYDMIKIINNNIVKANIDTNKKNKLIDEFKEKSNIVL